MTDAPPGDLLRDMLSLVVALIVTVLPGLVIAIAAGFRGWLLSAVPLLTYGAAAATLTVDAVWHTGFTVVTLALTTVVLAVLAWVTRFVRIPARDEETFRKYEVLPPAQGWEGGRWASRVLLVCIGLGSAFSVAVLYVAIGGLNNVHQDWDAAFHGMAIRLVDELGTARAEALGEVIDPESAESFFYPAAWHALSALGLLVADPGVARVLNASMVIIGPVAVVCLAGFVRLWSGRPTLAAVTALVLPWSAAFPYDLLWRGPIAPYAIGLAITPAVCTLTIHTLRTRSLSAALMLGVGAAGLVALHPSTVFSAAGLVAAMVIHRWVTQRGRTVGMDSAFLVLASLLAIPTSLTVLYAAFAVVDGGVDVDWSAYYHYDEAVAALLMDSNRRGTHNVTFGVLLLLGLVTSGRGIVRWLWWVLCFAVFGWLFVITASSDSAWVQTVTGPWWNDAFRLIAFFWLGGSVVVALGVVGSARLVCRGVAWVAGRLKRERLASVFGDGHGYVVTATAFVVVATAFVTSGFGSFARNVVPTSADWREWTFVSPSEQLAYDTLARTLGKDVLVLNDANDGSPWLYTLEGVPVVFLQRLGMHQIPGFDPGERLLLEHFKEIADNTDVQREVVKRGITHVVLGTRARQPPGRWGGLLELKESSWLERRPDIWPLEVWEITPQPIPDKTKKEPPVR